MGLIFYQATGSSHGQCSKFLGEFLPGKHISPCAAPSCLGAAGGVRSVSAGHIPCWFAARCAAPSHLRAAGAAPPRQRESKRRRAEKRPALFSSALLSLRALRQARRGGGCYRPRLPRERRPQRLPEQPSCAASLREGAAAPPALGSKRRGQGCSPGAPGEEQAAARRAGGSRCAGELRGAMLAQRAPLAVAGAA